MSERHCNCHHNCHQPMMTVYLAIPLGKIGQLQFNSFPTPYILLIKGYMKGSFLHFRHLAFCLRDVTCHQSLMTELMTL